MSLKPPNISPVEEMPSDTIFSTCKGELNNLIHGWCSSSDTLYCIHPVDGSLLIWVVDYIDDFTSAYYRQVQVSFASRIPATFSKADATSLCWTHTYHYTQAQLNQANLDTVENSESHIKTKNIKTDKLAVLQSSYMVSAHADGSLNLWLVSFSDNGSFTGIASITHVTRSCGPRFGTTQLVVHPALPLVIGTSQRSAKVDEDTNAAINDIESELILWNTNHVSPLSDFKGVTEMARISSPDPYKFLRLSWIPELFHFSLLSITNDGIDLLPNAPSTCFVAASSNGLHLYEILLDAKSLLSNLGMLKFSASLPHHMKILSDLIESEQSGSQSACIMNVCQLIDSSSINNVQFLHVFNRQSICYQSADQESNSTSKDNQEFFIAAIHADGLEQKICIWRIEVSFTEKFASVLSPVSVEGEFSPTTTAPPSSALTVTHCVKQDIVYHKSLTDTFKTFTHFSASSDLASSNDFYSLPLKFHLAGVSSESITCWELRENEGRIISVNECYSIDTNLAWDEDIVCLSFANSSRYAYVSKKKGSGITRNLYLHIKESETSGEEQWSTEYSDLFCPDVDYSESDKACELSWLSLENGQYLLAVAANNQVYVFCKSRTPVIGNSKGTKHVFNWDILKEVKIGNDFNDLFSLTTITWSSGGFFMVGVENEIQVYSQWEDNIEVMFKTKNCLTTMLNESVSFNKN